MECGAAHRLFSGLVAGNGLIINPHTEDMKWQLQSNHDALIATAT